MKSLLRTVAYLALFVAIQTPQALATSKSDKRANAVVYNTKGQVSGPVFLIKAYQALIAKNAASLLSMLNVEPSPINQSLVFSMEGKDIKLRLIHIAVLTKDPIMIGLLINLGARVGAKDSEGRNAAHYAAFAASELSSIFDFNPENDSEIASAILEFLHTQKVDLNERDRWLRAPIHYAAVSGSPPVLSTLINLGVNIDPADVYGFTPRQLAMRSGLHITAAQLLSQAGSDSRIHWRDIAAGAKNKAKSFALAYPFFVAAGAVTTVATAVIGIAATLSRPTHNVRDLTTDDLSESDDFHFNAKINLNLPAAPLVFPGGSADVAVIAPSKNQHKPAKSATTKKSQRLVRLEKATREINAARRSQVLDGIRLGIQNAEDLLGELEGIELDEESKTQRKYLIAAIKSVTKLKTLPSQISQSVQRILKEYEKYRKR